jgi:translation initiation factor IF-2
MNCTEVFEFNSGKLKTFKHHKKDINEAAKGLECGMCLDNFADLKEGDVIQAIIETRVKRVVS